MTREPCSPSARWGLLQVCAAGVLWGTGGLVVTVLNDRDGLGAMTVSAWRMLLAAAALLGFVASLGRLPSLVDALRRHPVRVVLIGCGTATYQGLYFVSVLLAGVTLTTVVSLGLAPVLATTWEHVVRRSRPVAREVAVLACALTGLVLVTAGAGEVTHGGPGGPDSPTLGLVLAIASGATYAATTLLGREVAQVVDPVTLTTGATMAGAVALSPFLLLAGPLAGPAAPTDATSWLLLVYLGVATMALSYGLLYAGLRTTSGSAATVATLVEPLSAAALAAVLLGERLPAVGLVGGALILLAVVALRPEEQTPAPPP